MSPTLTAFKVRPTAAGAWRATCAVRWALEEVGQPYEVRWCPSPR
jgi:uncharacterized protein YycO